jgi:UDP-N-acetylglucosamine--N-acetylmuramyl-(pentapeptide) pyrophosphoryl-undecaprenol N-acetylglucosamine transferase
MAKTLGKKTIIHEQNINMGRANRLLLKSADRVCLSFNGKPKGAGSKYIFTGNPIRESVLNDFKTLTKNSALSRLGFSAGRKTLLILGGSSGSSAINKLLMHLSYDMTTEEKERLQIIHLTGTADLQLVDEHYNRNNIIHWTRDFYERMGLLYKAADFIICRSGATTIAEMCIFGLPAVFIPYPGAGSHQIENASVITRAGGAMTLKQKNATVNILKKDIFSFIDSEKRLSQMSSMVRSFAAYNAASRLADVVEGLREC